MNKFLTLLCLASITLTILPVRQDKTWRVKTRKKLTKSGTRYKESIKHITPKAALKKLQEMNRGRLRHILQGKAEILFEKGNETVEPSPLKMLNLGTARRMMAKRLLDRK